MRSLLFVVCLPLAAQTPDQCAALHKHGDAGETSCWQKLSRSADPAARAEGIEFNVGFRAFHLCRSSRRFRKAGELAVATMADANMLTLHHPALLEGDEAIDQVTRGIHRIRAWADPIKKARN